MAKTVAEALGTTFTYQGRSKVGREMNDAQLQWYAEKGPEALKGTALTLLEETVVTQGETGIVRVQKAAAKPATPPPPEAPPDDWQTFDKPIVGQNEATSDTTKLLALCKHILDNTLVLRGELFDIKELLGTSKPQPTAPAAGVGQGGGMEFATRAVLEHKNGKVYVNFWNDDNAKLKYSVIYGAKPAQEWQKLLPWVNPAYFQQMSDKEWFTSFPELDKVGQFPCRCNVYYTLSSKMNTKGTAPFKDITRIEKA